MFLLLYTVLFSLSLILINPWGSILFFTETGRAEVWTFPKIFVLTIIVGFNLAIILNSLNCFKAKFIDRGKVTIFVSLWSLYIFLAIISTLFSPFPLHSLLGHPALGDGLLYWILMAGFSITNVLVLRLNPKLLKSQLRGFLFGGCVVALSIIPQFFNWRIDYTVTSGQVSDFESQLLVSSIWQMQMPIGLYSNRGHASFVLAAIITLCIAAILNRWISGKGWKFGCFLMGIALLMTQTFAGILACIVGLLYLILRQTCHTEVKFWKYKTYYSLKWLISCILILLFILIATFVTFLIRQYFLDDVNTIQGSLENLLSGRLYLWSLGWQGILQRPFIGWGFSGFGIAHLFIADWAGKLNDLIPNDAYIAQILNLHEATFEFLGFNGELYSGIVFSHKAHNLFLDVILSTGFLGAISYFSLLGYAFFSLASSRLWPFSAVVVVYLLFTQAWFECAQFSHIAWWCLNLGIAASDAQLGVVLEETKANFLS